MIRSLIVITLLCFVPVYGQQIHLRWKNDTVQVGEHAILLISIKDKPKDLDYRPLQGNLHCETKTFSGKLWQSNGEVEILGFKDSLIKNGSKEDYIGTYTIVAWDSAMYKVLPLWFVKKDSSFAREVPILNVVFKKKKVDLGIEEIPVSFISDAWSFFYKYWWMFFVGISIILIAYFWNKRRKIKPKDVLTLRERTLLALGELKKKEDWNKGREKEHYSAFSSILKMYIGARFELNLMERTTYETKLLLQQKGLNPTLVNRIHELLQEADLIKFAKQPSEDLVARSSMRKLEELILELSPLEIPK